MNATAKKNALYLLLGFFFLCPIQGIAQDSTIELEKAVLQLREALTHNNTDGIGQARAALERIQQMGDETGWAAYYHGLSSYRLAAMTPDKKMQLQHIDQAIRVLEELIKKNDSHAEAAILLSGAYGWKAGLKPMRSMFLGPKANEFSARANALEPNNPRVNMLIAISKFNTPPMFGGDKDAAMEGFYKAAELYKTHQPPTTLSPVWGYDDTYAWIGQGYVANQNFEAARKAYEEALSINPNNAWVRYILLPQAEAGITSTN